MTHRLANLRYSKTDAPTNYNLPNYKKSLNAVMVLIIVPTLKAAVVQLTEIRKMQLLV